MSELSLFDMLTWNPHPAGSGERAVMDFENGYEASVLRGGCWYTTNGTYEVAITRNGVLCYNTPIADDALGYLTQEQAEEALCRIRDLPAVEGSEVAR